MMAAVARRRRRATGKPSWKNAIPIDLTTLLAKIHTLFPSVMERDPLLDWPVDVSLVDRRFAERVPFVAVPHPPSEDDVEGWDQVFTAVRDNLTLAAQRYGQLFAYRELLRKSTT